MNVGTLKTLSYLTSFGLLGGIGYIGYDYYENGRSASYFDVARASDVLNGVQPPDPPKRVALDYVADISPAIVTFDWTGKPPEERTAVVETGPDDNAVVLTPVSDVLEVLMVLSDVEDPGASLCMVRFRDAAASPRMSWYAIGSTLPAPNETISIARIFGESVEFSFADRAREREVVLLSDQAADPVIVSLDDPSMVVKPKAADLVQQGQKDTAAAPTMTEKRNGQFYIGTEDAALFQNNYADIFSRDVKTETYYDKDGNRAGIKITEVRPGSIAQRHGAQTGDVIISINGTSVHSQQEAIKFAKDNSDRYSVWEVQVMNLGRVRTEVYHSSND